MKHLQKFNERKFFTIKYNDHELSVDDIQRGKWSVTDHLNPKIDSLLATLTEIKSRVNTKGARVYSDEADKIDQMYSLVNAPVIDDLDQVFSNPNKEEIVNDIINTDQSNIDPKDEDDMDLSDTIQQFQDIANEIEEEDEQSMGVAVVEERVKSFSSFKN